MKRPICAEFEVKVTKLGHPAKYYDKCPIHRSQIEFERIMSSTSLGTAARKSAIPVALVIGVALLAWNWQAAREARRAEKAQADQEALEKQRLAVKLYFKRLEFGENSVGRASDSAS